MHSTSLQFCIIR